MYVALLGTLFTPTWVGVSRALRIRDRLQGIQTLVLLVAVVWSLWLLNHALALLGLPPPTKAGYTAFYAALRDWAMVGEHADYGWVGFFCRPLLALILLLDRTFHDLGLSLVCLAVMVHLVVQAATFRHREAYRHQLWLERMLMLPARHRIAVRPTWPYVAAVAQVLVLVVLYFVIAWGELFQASSRLVWWTFLARRDPYLVLPLIGAAVAVAQTWLQRPWDGEVSRERLAAVLGASAMLAAFVLWLLPAGLALVAITMSVLGIGQVLVDTRVERRRLLASLATPALALTLLLAGAAVLPGGAAPLARPVPSAPVLPAAARGERTQKPARVAQLEAEGRWGDAIEELERMLVDAPADVDLRRAKVDTLYRAAAGTLERGGERYDAYRYLQQALKVDPEHAESRARLARIYVDAGAEEMHAVSARAGPSEFYSLAGTAAPGDAYAVAAEAAADGRAAGDWIPILWRGGRTAWLLRALVELERMDTGRRVKVTRRRARGEVTPLLDTAARLDPALRWRVWRLKYQGIAVPVAVLLTLVGGVGLLIRTMY
jgi:membrane protein insertase Oxa1/YidC/SpoIIIJ